MLSLGAMPYAWAEGPVPSSADDVYEVGHGDVFVVQVAGEPEFSGRAVVSHDGTAEVPFIGPIDVTGMTTGAIRERLTSLLASDYLVDPRVSVQMETYASQPVRVLGAVKSPGVYFLQGPTTISEMLARAGGIVEEDHVVEVQVRSEDGSRQTVALDDLLQHGTADLGLARGDVVYLPAGEVVYLAGQVQQPGAVTVGDGLTVMQALTRVGGPKETARLTGAYVLRDGEQIGVNLRRIMRGKDPDLALQSGDQVFLKKSVF